MSRRTIFSQRWDWSGVMPGLGYATGVTKRCSVCRAEIRSGGARGLCARCYQRERRHLPTSVVPDKAPAGEGDRVTFRLDRAVKETVRKLAKREGIAESDWYRRAVSNELKQR